MVFINTAQDIAQDFVQDFAQGQDSTSVLYIFTSSLQMKHQIFLAVLLVFFGVILITAAFFVPNNPRHGLYKAGIQQAAFLHPPRYGLCRKVRHSGKRGGGDKRERSSEDSTTAQALHIIPHLHLRLHTSHTRALFLS